MSNYGLLVHLSCRVPEGEGVYSGGRQINKGCGLRSLC